jgi:CheY-like chemotaxis protein/two-component sensor histidine kinase
MPAQRHKILIVDDEPDMRKVINDILTEAGYDTYLAENGAHALELAAAVSPDLILSDIQMPSMNGYELLNNVKVDPELGKIPFVFMTGVNVGRYDLRKGMDLGADDYLTKPFTVEELVNAVGIRLRKQQLWKAFTDSKLTKTQTGFIMLLSNELHILVMDILEHAQSLLAGTDVARSDMEKAAQMITRSGKRLSHLHENILYYSMLQIWVKDEETIAAMRKEETASYLSVLNSILHENPRTKARLQSITVKGSDAALQISPADFGKIIYELADNACKFSDAESSIFITAEQGERMLTIAIGDSGRGMTKEEIEQSASLFRPQQPLQRRTDGGVGLIIAITIAELYGGKVTIDSTPQTGTTVSVALPKVR